MRAAIIENATVVNVVEVPNLTILPNLVDATSGGSIGDKWDGVNFKSKEHHG